MGDGAIAARGGALTIASQLGRFIISFGSSVILARLIAPQDFGYMAMVAAIISIGEAVLDAGLSTASIRRAELPHRLHSNLFWMNLALGIGFAAVLWLSAPAIAAFYGHEQVAEICRATAGVFALVGACAQFRVHLVRQSRFGALAIIDVVAGLSGAVIGLTLAFSGAGYWALVGSIVTTAVVGSVSPVFVARWWPSLPMRRQGTRAVTKDGLAIAGGWALSLGTRNVDSIALGRVAGASVLAQYDRGFQLLMVPLYQFTWPISKVVLPLLGRSQHDMPRYLGHLRHGQLLSSYGVATIYALCIGLGPSITVALYGERWVVAGELLRFLAVAGIFRALSQVAGWAFVSRGYSGAQLRFDLVAQPLSIVVILLGLPWGAVGVATGYAAAAALYWLISMVWMGRRTHLDVSDLLRAATRALLVAAMTSAVAAVAGALPLSPWLRVVSGSTAAALWLLAAVATIPAVRRDALDILHIVTSARRASNPTSLGSPSNLSSMSNVSSTAPDQYSPPPLGWFGAVLVRMPLRLRRSIFFIRSTRRLPRFVHPRTFLQKMNWRILYYHNPDHAWVSDRLKAKERVLALAPEFNIPKTIWSGADLSLLEQVTLPERWVLKANNRSGAVYFGRGQAVSAELAVVTKHWLFPSEAEWKGEWTYSLADQVFVVEEWLGDADSANPPNDLKISLFNGRVEYLHIHIDRFTDHQSSGYSRDWTFMPGIGMYEKDWEIPRPEKLDEIIAAAERIAVGFDFLRVDLYSTDRGIFFGETTYYCGGGFTPWVSPKSDRELGALWTLPAATAPTSRPQPDRVP